MTLEFMENSITIPSDNQVINIYQNTKKNIKSIISEERIVRVGLIEVAHL